MTKNRLANVDRGDGVGEKRDFSCDLRIEVKRPRGRMGTGGGEVVPSAMSCSTAPGSSVSMDGLVPGDFTLDGEFVRVTTGGG